jgi:hypothetical protein
MLKNASIVACCLAALALPGCDTTPKKAEIQSVDYGPRPQHWQAAIRDYLKIRLRDPAAAVVEFRAGPQQLYQREIPLRGKQWGWAVCVWVNDKNRQGAFEGFYPMSVLIRNEKIEHVNGGPDDDNLLGNRYAREHCEQLGAPFRK